MIFVNIYLVHVQARQCLGKWTVWEQDPSSPNENDSPAGEQVLEAQLESAKKDALGSAGHKVLSV